MLSTGRLSLRRPVPADVDATRFIRWDEHWERFGFGRWTVHHGSRRVGFCGVEFVRFRDWPVLELHYRFAESAWADGIVGEAATAVVEWAARQRPEDPVIARVRPDDEAAHRVATEAGLVRVDHLTEPGYQVYLSGRPT